MYTHVKDALVNDENARVFLSNKLTKSKQRLSELTYEVETKRKELEGLVSLKDAYENNRSLGNSDSVTEVRILSIILNIFCASYRVYFLCIL